MLKNCSISKLLQNDKYFITQNNILLFLLLHSVYTIAEKYLKVHLYFLSSLHIMIHQALQYVFLSQVNLIPPS